MSLFLNDRHATLRAEVRAFAEEQVRPQVACLEARHELIEELARCIARKGWIGATIPSRYGGLALGHLAKTIILEELSRVSGAVGAVVQASQLGVAKVLHFGTEAQKLRWLPLFASGASLPTIAVTEWESGGHVLDMASTARREADGYVLEGHKCFVGNSHIGDVHGIVVRTGPGTRGLSAFLVERDRPGLTLGTLGEQIGLHGFSYGELRFSGCRVPETQRLGREGQGLDVAYSSSTLYGRPNLTAVALGIHQAILEDTVRFCEQRHHSGKPLSALPIVSAKVGEMYSRLLTARTVAYHAVALLDRGEPCDAELMNAKLVNTESALTSARVALEIFAARGCQRGHAIERYLRDVLHTFPAAGTSDVQRLRLAEVAFGAPHEPWSSRLRELVRLEAPVPSSTEPSSRVAPQERERLAG